MIGLGYRYVNYFSQVLRFGKKRFVLQEYYTLHQHGQYYKGKKRKLQGKINTPDASAGVQCSMFRTVCSHKVVAVRYTRDASNCFNNTGSSLIERFFSFEGNTVPFGAFFARRKFFTAV